MTTHDESISMRAPRTDALDCDAGTSQRMSRIARKDTAPELALRRALHSRGWRYFVDRTIDGTRCRPDLSFPRLRVAVFVDGCFWHYCEEHTHIPRRNSDYWLDKLLGNRRRDVATTSRLERDGWSVVRVWEHDPLREAAGKVEAELLSARRRMGVSHGPAERTGPDEPTRSSTGPGEVGTVAG
ncbi:very short patch repair endonuclease [Frigoribacterium sp. NPDC087798]|uniref:very short patch repair endonuclease n=1 Tax=Frigoribacterium sp. NPDC087798 TaxID=3363993 RepID=UPI00381150F4